MDSSPPPTPKPKRWPVALLIAFISGIIGAIAAAPVSDWAMQAHHVSNFEGGRGYAVMCIWFPLGFIVSFVAAFAVSLQIKRSGFAGYLIKQGIALAVVAVIVAAAGGLGYATAEHPPLLEGQPLALEIQVQMPAAGHSIDELKARDFRVALLVVSGSSSYADMRWAEATQSDDVITVGAWATLKSRNADRDISVSFGGENPQLFHVMLPPAPKKTNDDWSAWLSSKEQPSQANAPSPNEYRVRYRVRFDAEYSPTPHPMPEYSPTTSPEESPSPDESATP